MDVLSKDQRRRNMQAIKSKGSKDEVLLAKTLWNKGLRYRKNDKSVFGKPDLTFKRKKMAIFIDSEYFHGYNWDIQKNRIKTNQEFWWRKIESNIKRDELVNKELKSRGWKVLRFWSKYLRNNLANCVTQIEDNL
ncbi:MAG: very short patch repair endonuclease [Bacteroidetes bacterium]|nr:very short patch repair endonuclease [Bacteroidota bacterium]